MMCYFAGVICTSPGGAKITNFHVAYGRRSIFCNFQNASPCNLLRPFSEKLHSCKLPRLQTGAVSASVRIPTPLAMTCEHGRKN